MEKIESKGAREKISSNDKPTFDAVELMNSERYHAKAKGSDTRIVSFIDPYPQESVQVERELLRTRFEKILGRPVESDEGCNDSRNCARPCESIR